MCERVALLFPPQSVNPLRLLCEFVIFYFFFFLQKRQSSISICDKSRRAEVVSEGDFFLYTKARQVISSASAAGFQCLLISRTHARARSPLASDCCPPSSPSSLGVPPAKELCRGKWKAVEQESTSCLVAGRRGRCAKAD